MKRSIFRQTALDDKYSCSKHNELLSVIQPGKKTLLLPSVSLIFLCILWLTCSVITVSVKGPGTLKQDGNFHLYLPANTTKQLRPGMRALVELDDFRKASGIVTEVSAVTDQASLSEVTISLKKPPESSVSYSGQATVIMQTYTPIEYYLYYE